jgi:hypothetical protein
MATKPSAPAVSRALSAAGMSRSETSTTRIRGWHHYSSGFRVSTWKGIDYVDVEWTTGEFGRDDHSPENMQNAAKILTDKGYSVEIVTSDNGRVSLKITKPENGS